MTPMLLAAALTGLAHAQTCDARLLEKQAMAAAPSAMADAWLALANCSEKAALKMAPTHMQRMVADKASLPAIVKAIEIGAEKSIRAWLDEETPDVRSRLIAKIGGACKDNPAVATFFVNARAELGAAFWDDRWHKGLDDCRTPAVQKLLADALTSDDVGRDNRNQQQFFGVVEVYARNLGVDAIPTLKEFLANPKNEEEATLMVNSFADAANVGSMQGMNQEAADAAIAALVELAPTLPQRAVERARRALDAMKAPEQANALAKFAWTDHYVDGAYTYAMSAVEDVTCKNGKRYGLLHLGSFTESGNLWPDQLAEQIEAKLLAAWSPDSAEKCKGTGTITVTMSDAPVNAEELAAWHAEQEQQFAATMAGAKKSSTVTHASLAW